VNQAIYTWHPYTWLLGGVDVAYGYWANLLHPEIEVEDIGYGLVKFRDGSHGKILSTTCFGAPKGVRLLEIVGEHGTVFSSSPWLRTLDFRLNDERLDAALHRDLEKARTVLDHSPYAPWGEDDQTARIRAQMGDFLAAIQEHREPVVSAESGAEPIKILDGFHWHGWRHADRFRDWLRAVGAEPGSQVPPTTEDAAATGWTGDRLLEQLLALVRSPAPTLEAPFLNERP